jgi:two-component system, response regulator PdtaR
VSHALIIEDNYLVAEMLQEVLLDLGHTSVEVVCTEPDAIAAAVAQSPALIIADVELPTGDGIKAVRTICEGKSIPVVFATAHPLEVARQMPGAVVLTKPFGSLTVTQSVKQALRASRKGETAPP